MKTNRFNEANPLNRRDFLRVGLGMLGIIGLIGLLPVVSRAGQDVTVANRPPNIIFILADDVGLDQISCYGGKFPTPHIDALAKGGTRFEYSYSTPLCGPSRFQLLTGCYPFRSGLNTNGNWSRNQISPQKQIMLSTVMKQAGYVTASAGKWGQMPLGPSEWGFDEYIKISPGNRYWGSGENATYESNGKTIPIAKDEYVPDTVQKFVVNFITHHQDKPFFVYYPMSFTHKKLYRTPDSKPGVKGEQLMTDSIAYMDKQVGQLAAELDRLKLREKTLLIFTGDNGSGRGGKLGDRTILGGKASMLEGGSRVPLIVNWPGTTPAGTVNHDLTDFSDFFPTFAELGGAKLPDGVIIDGQSFAAQVKGEKGKPREWVRVEFNGASYVRDARYKLTNGGEMFDMKNAPFEEIPVPKDSTDAGIAAARQRLQKILDQHPAAPDHTGSRKSTDAAAGKKGAEAD